MKHTLLLYLSSPDPVYYPIDDHFRQSHPFATSFYSLHISKTLHGYKLLYLAVYR